MSRAPLPPIFVDRKAAAEMLMISVDTFDTWLRAGFIPRAQIDRGQIVRWHWPSLEAKLAGPPAEPAVSDPFVEGARRAVEKAEKSRRRAAA
jgi:hypothetical protein